MIDRVKTAALKELQKIAIESLADNSALDGTDIEELSDRVIEMLGSERMSEEVYFAQYEKGYEAGMRRIATCQKSSCRITANLRTMVTLQCCQRKLVSRLLILRAFTGEFRQPSGTNTILIKLMNRGNMNNG